MIRFFLCFFTSLNLYALLPPAPLSLEEKIGALLVVHFHGTSLNEEALFYLNHLHVGGFIYYTWANPFSNPEEIKTLNSALQSLSKIPLLIGVDQEGGKVIRLKEGFSQFASQQTIASRYSPTYAYASALITGQELRFVGINTNFAPVVDVDSNPLNPIIGSRSFSSDPHKVVEFAQNSLQGYREASVLATLKHFPGHGDTTADSHLTLPVVNKSLNELLACELYPYQHLQADAIMTAHILVPALDPKACATISQPILQHLLRETLHFQGLIISDSLVMQGLLQQTGSIEEAAILALNAGCDLLLLGGKLLQGSAHYELSPQDIQKIHQALVHAVHSGRLSMARIDQSIQKILAIKEKYRF
ncbi:MAG: beta-N-acetylhexosaminidase [Chlamydiae bacterium]|nr:beta-N-acetylhexosaminidase [Chlamydiota bacterium]